MVAHSAPLESVGGWTRIGAGKTSYDVYTKPIQKSPQDDREYRLIRLENGLQAMLVHHAKADKSAASLDVAVGHLYDPVSIWLIVLGRSVHDLRVLILTHHFHCRTICPASRIFVNICCSWFVDFPFYGGVTHVNSDLGDGTIPERKRILGGMCWFQPLTRLQVDSSHRC